MITDYDIVCDGEMSGLKKEVRALMRLGWQPVGGVSYSNNYFYQAVTKSEPEIEYGLWNGQWAIHPDGSVVHGNKVSMTATAQNLNQDNKKHDWPLWEARPLPTE